MASALLHQKKQINYSSFLCLTLRESVYEVKKKKKKCFFSKTKDNLASWQPKNGQKRHFFYWKMGEINPLFKLSEFFFVDLEGWTDPLQVRILLGYVLR